MMNNGRWSCLACRRDTRMRIGGTTCANVSGGLRHVVRTGAPWRWMPDDPPPRAALCQQTQRWPAACCFGALVDDPRAVPRLAAGYTTEPTAAVLARIAAFRTDVGLVLRSA